MLGRLHRFHGYSSLSLVHRKGATVRSGQLVLRYIRNTQRRTYRVAVIVSRKIHKSAVQRNRVRRRIYEIIRTAPPIVEPYDLVVTVFSDQVIDSSPGELTSLVTGLLRKAGVYQTTRPDGGAHAIVKPREEDR